MNNLEEKSPNHERIVVGDECDHDFGILFWPNNIGCLSWVGAEVGALILGFALGAKGTEFIPFASALPIVYALGYIYWMSHDDILHSPYFSDHHHYVTEIIKKPIKMYCRARASSALKKSRNT